MKIALAGGTREAASALRDVIGDWVADNLPGTEISMYRSGEEMLRQAVPGRYEMNFISTVMPDMRAIRLMEELWKKAPATNCVFVASDETCMPEALEYHAFDYLLRPLGQEQIFRVLRDLRERVPQAAPFFSYIFDRRVCHMMFHDLFYVISSGHYLELHSRTAGIRRIRMTMKELQERLHGDERFLVINKGILVNMDHILSMHSGKCEMDDAKRSRLPVSAQKHIRLREQWHQYIYQSLSKKGEWQNF